MRDPIREKDIEQRLGATAGGVEVDVADNGIAVITIKRDDLDVLLNLPADLHEDCIDVDDHQTALADERFGYDKGHAAALAEIRSLATGSAA